MKNTAHQPMTLAPSRARRARPEGVKTDHSRAQQRHGAYKRFEIFLGLEAAIALRSLMRDGRSAREVIEALLLDERQRRQRDLAPDAPRAR
jgi:hypothetical protein